MQEVRFRCSTTYERKVSNSRQRLLLWRCRKNFWDGFIKFLKCEPLDAFIYKIALNLARLLYIGAKKPLA
jgi:hypothetical protein